MGSQKRIPRKLSAAWRSWKSGGRLWCLQAMRVRLILILVEMEVSLRCVGLELMRCYLSVAVMFARVCLRGSWHVGFFSTVIIWRIRSARLNSWTMMRDWLHCAKKCHLLRLTATSYDDITGKVAWTWWLRAMFTLKWLLENCKWVIKAVSFSFRIFASELFWKLKFFRTKSICMLLMLQNSHSEVDQILFVLTVIKIKPQFVLKIQE